MAQHDYNLINQSGASFRADLNNALSAIATNNAGASSPSTTFAYEWWIDESNGVLKIRNSANSAWITTGINLTTNNLFTGDITGNAPTATILANTRTINGVAFNGSANISFNSDSVSEGSSNLYFTNERTDDRVNDLLVAGSGISLTYNDTNNTLTVANTNDADITSVVAGNALSGGGTSGAVTLNVAVDDSSIEIDSDALRVKASGITNTMLAGSIANSKLANSSVTINSQTLSLGSSLTLNTNNISEGISNLYYTDARFDTRLATKDTDNLGEGTNNLYYTNERVDDRVATLIQNGTGISFTYDDTNATLTPVITLSPFDTSNLSESGNLYYTDARARAAISENSTQLSYDSGTGVLTYTQGDTDTVAEGANLYYTDARANTAIDARVTNTFINNLSGVVADTTTALATARSIALSGDVVGTVSFDGTSDVTISSTIQANSVALSTDTTGDYVQTITGTNNKITVSGSGTEGRDVTLTLPSDVQIANDLTVAGNLTVNGTLTSLDTTNLDIEDNLFQLNAGLTGSPVNDSGMLINRGNQNNGIFMWDESADKFTMGLTTADGSSTGNITLASLGTLVVNVEGAVTGNVTGQVSDISNFTTANLTENTNLYYTQARFDTAFGNKSTTNLSEGTNLYYTDARVQAVSINNLVEDTTPQLGGDLATNSNDILFADNDKAIFGAGSDLQIYHDGNNSFIDETGTGNLYIKSNSIMHLMSDDIRLMNAANSETILKGVVNGAVTLYHDNAAKLATTSTGIDVTGTVVSDSLTVDTTTLVVDSSNNRVGIGTSNPSATLSLDKTGVNQHRALDLENDDITYSMYIDQDNNNSNTWSLFDTTNSQTALRYYPSSSGYWQFLTNGIERMRIDSSGNFIVGATSPFSADSVTIDQGGFLAIRNTSGSGMEVRRDGTDGNLIDFQKDGSAVGSIGANAGVLTIGNNNSGGIIFGYNGSHTFIEPSNTSGASVDAGATLGSSSKRFKDLFLSGGVSVIGTTPFLMVQDTDTNNSGVMEQAGTDLFYGNSSSSGTHIFKNNSSNGGRPSVNGTELMRISSTGKITTRGTTASGYAVLEFGTININTNLSDGTVDFAQGLAFTNNVTNEGAWTQAGICATGSSGYNGNLVFGTDGNSSRTSNVITERMRITTSGKVGIGTTSPSQNLDVQASTVNTGVLFYNTNTTAGASVPLFLGSESGGSTTNTSIENAGAGNMVFRTGATSKDGFGTERMRIDSSGNVEIGGITNTGSFKVINTSSQVCTFDRRGTDGTVVLIRNDDTNVGSISVSGSSTAYNTSSDYRLKENVDYDFTALDRVKQLKPARFNFIVDADTTVDGFIAHEVQDIVPEAVTGEKDGEEMQGIDQSKLVPLLTKAIQEQQDQIDKLSKEIVKLKKK